jgi:hypothetical protein
MPQEITILDKPQLPPSADYAYLRSKGLEYIEKLGSKLWTDYNIHDPGITLMELLSYAISDLGYRTGFDTKDILAVAPNESARPELQAFFTARQIMTVSPLTQNDYRKLLIDVAGVKNGWMQCKSCGCDNHYLYADCKTSKLQYELTEHKITLKGMYDVLVEFEDEEGVGDLNNGKIKYNLSFLSHGKLTNAVMEMRLPSWHEIEEDTTGKYDLLREAGTTVAAVTVNYISGNKIDDSNINDDLLANALRKPIYIGVTVTLHPADNSGDTDLTLDFVPATLLFHHDEDRTEIKLADIEGAVTKGDILQRYAERIQKADDIISDVRHTLHANRNLCEDYCTIKAIQTEEVALCADIDVTPDADIEKVMAQIYYLADQYMSTDVKFYSLKELLDAGRTTEDIFDGPVLSNGFIDNDQLETTQLKTVLHSSDLINLIMDVPGVAAVRNFTLVKYDRDGNRSEAQSWSMNIAFNHQPRLYLEGSRLVAYKNGLPFLPDRLELSDTLQVIKGQNIQPKYALTDLDIAVPAGTYYSLDEYYPLQYSLPATYGVGEAGLPATATAERKTQAQQLKAYLLFFEQLLVNYLQQLSHVKDFFSLDTNVNRSYFTRLLSDADIAGVSGFYDTNTGNINQSILDGLTESDTTFLDRRSRFLEHLLSRFAEQFTDYTLMVYSLSDNKKLADRTLINDKIAFLRDYPFISSNRARAVDYKNPDMVCNAGNVAGLQRRIERLLGFEGIGGYISFVKDYSRRPVVNRWQLADDNGNVLLLSEQTYSSLPQNDLAEKIAEVVRETLVYLRLSSSYNVELMGGMRVVVRDVHDATVAYSRQTFTTVEEAQDFIDKTVAFVNYIDNSQRIHVVEHLLLRPRNWTTKTIEFFQEASRPYDPFNIPSSGANLGPVLYVDGNGPEFGSGGDFPVKYPHDSLAYGPDQLLPICIPPDCNTCGDEDPYSFRMSIVMNGEVGMASSSLEFRRFAEETIRMETPAHLGLKVCWVSTESLNEFGAAFCAWQQEISKETPDEASLSSLLANVLNLLNGLENVYPPARLHDCQEGSEDSRVFLNHTII